MDIEHLIKSEDYVFMGERTTICLLVLTSGFEIVGTAHCADPAVFDQTHGKYWARKDAVAKLEAFEIYRKDANA